MATDPLDQSCTPATSASVQVIIVSYQSGPHLQRCVDALEAQTFTDWEAAVWDNASTDGALDGLRIGPRVRIERSEANLGFAAANNRAAKLSNSRYIAFLNPDAFPEPDWLARLVAAAASLPVEAVASLQLDDARPELLDGAGDCMSVAGVPWRGGFGHPRAVAPIEPCEVFSACAAAALYRRDAFEALGGFEESFFCYCEDVDLGFRLRLAGGRCVLEPRAVVRHVGGASSGGGSAFAEHHGSRNRLWVLMRNMPVWLLPIAAPAHVLVMLFVLSRHRRLLPARLRGIAEALRGGGPWTTPRPPRRGRAIDLARALSWSPLAAARKDVVSRRIAAGPRFDRAWVTSGPRPDIKPPAEAQG